MPDLSAQRMADRKRRQAEFIALLRTQPDRETIAIGLRRAFIETDVGRDPAYERAQSERDAGYVHMLVELGATLTPEQKDAVRERVSGLQADIARLSRG
jgi:5-carboxymethyl-2-hydroxymuconate isomerase